jgi:hypothetical protein
MRISMWNLAAECGLIHPLDGTANPLIRSLLAEMVKTARLGLLEPSALVIERQFD